MGLVGNLRNAMFRLPLERVEGAHRGFLDGPARPRLDRVAKCVVHAYNLGLQHDDPDRLAFLLELNDPELQGFAYEGGAMGLMAADLWSLRTDRFPRFVAGPAHRHRYMAHVGAGLVLGVFRRNPQRHLEALDPFLCWLVLNGYGFHAGFFRTELALERCQVAPSITGTALGAHDEGLGRALWFARAGQPLEISQVIEGFPESRRGAIWAGIGLACVYAHGVDEATGRAVRTASGHLYPYLFQGALMAAHTRHTAGNPTVEVDNSCTVLTDRSAARAHDLALDLMTDLSDRGRLGERTTWEVWQERLRHHAPATNSLSLAHGGSL